MRPLFYIVTPFGAALWFSEFMISWKKKNENSDISAENL